MNPRNRGFISRKNNDDNNRSGWRRRNRTSENTTPSEEFRSNGSNSGRNRNGENNSNRIHRGVRWERHAENNLKRDFQSRPYSQRANDNNGPSTSQNYHSKSDYSQNHKKNARAKHMSFKYLESLLQKPVEETINALSENKGFYDFLEKEQISADTFVLLMTLIKKFCECEFPSLRIRILQKTVTPAFLDKLHIYISSISVQDPREKRNNSYFWSDPDQFWLNFAKISKICIKEMPQFFAERLSKILKIFIVSFQNIEIFHQIHISDNIKKEYDDLSQSVDILLEEFKKEKKDGKKSTHQFDDNREPPNNFREITVYPTTIELISDEKPFLRKNIIEGPYRDVEQYLDIQFRLLREDFVGPLREGILNFLFGMTRKLQNIRIHKRVQFLNPTTVNHQNCVVLKFNWNNNKKSNFKYENSRRLMFGSLLLFTRDNFHSLLFGKVVDRKEESLKNGELIVGFDNDLETTNYLVDYMMVECNVYFEPYYHVLNVLKTMDEDNFPMKQYIVDVKKTEKLPNYITEDTFFDMSTIEHETILWRPEQFSFVQFESFNRSQNAAYIAALTKEFSIIQGPPGTGKTFVGLEIAKTLLRNSKAWHKNTPMLVICYTNHALDQFLEGLLNTTEKIVRVGGQSKNEKLNKFNLRALKHTFTRPTLELKTEVSKCVTEIKTITDTLNLIKNYDCIIDFNVFEHSVPNFCKSWLFTATKEQIEEWLFSEKSSRSHIVTLNQGLESMTLEDQVDSDENSDDDDKISTDNEEVHDEIEEFDNSLKDVRVEKVQIIFTLKEMRQNLNVYKKHLIYLQNQIQEGYDELSFEYANTAKTVECVEHNLRFAEMKFNDAKQGVFTKPEITDPRDTKYIQLNERWNLYFHWLNSYRNYLIGRYDKLNEHYREIYQLFSESKELDNLHVLKETLVIGMTTTGAARLHSTLKMLKSPIVIVEEAAEVLEAHIVTSLTTHCQQLILIGDHKQLRPSTSNYSVETLYYLGISLFERMILNNVQCFTLKVQHRMRPEIASLITPSIYPKLKNHESVLDRPHIKGVDKFLYFIDHQQLEERDDENTTKKNLHEAEFLIELAKYLVLNGHEPEQVTILAAYLGQMYEMQKARKKYKAILDGVKITVLDNYQGEESDIVLLSLVRSNKEGKIGFLSIENRVCVALSRARNGFFIMGNMSQLSGKSELWVKINETLKNQDAIGPCLTLRCQIHQKATMVSKADDFYKVVEGGCDKICSYRLPCGHDCQRLCHIVDRKHIKYQCQEICGKRLCENPLHTCRKKCYLECGLCNYEVIRKLLCGHDAKMLCSQLEIDCMFEVRTTLECGHITEKPCYLDNKKVKCPFPCDTRLDCGHACNRKCHIRDDPHHLKYKCPKPCERPASGCQEPENSQHKCQKLCGDPCEKCETLMNRMKECTHYFKLPCHQVIDEIKCTKPCKKQLACGHKCKGLCSEECPKCEFKVEKAVLGCGHKQKVKCCEKPNRLLCYGKCPRIMDCGHVCGRICKDDCNPLLCEETVTVSIKAICGHEIKRIPCRKYQKHAVPASPLLFMFNFKKIENFKGLEKYCTEPCRALLDCGKDVKHVCSGTCGECYQGRIHKRCGEKCGKFLVCNHECEVNCRETCRPCQRKCTYKCRHSACKKRCGEPCTKCIENCPRKCIHQRCLNKCGDICSVPPCNEPCDKNLECGHNCVGFCGDPCPPLCRICDKDELEEVFFGTEDDEDARWVLLRDCGHVLESSGMENWLSQDNDEIKFKVCPKCKTNIITTERYGDYIKEAVKDIENVKIKQYGQEKDISSKRVILEEQLEELNKKYAKMPLHIKKHLETYFGKLLDRLKITDKKGHKQHLNLVELNSIEIKYELFREIYDISLEIGLIIPSSSVIHQMRFILKKNTENIDEITLTEISDLRREINRFRRMVEFLKITSLSNYKMGIALSKVKAVNDEIDYILHSPKIIYNDAIDDDIKRKLRELLILIKQTMTISEIEKREIVKAIGLSQGHWFKCPNGHPYLITECGGAMEIGECNECGAQIGGQSHQLLASNSLAPEMDGARHAAWSNAANMDNYDLRDLN